MSVNVFGRTQDGEVVNAYTISNKSGMKAAIISFGATVTNLFVPDKKGELIDVQLGYDDLKAYEQGGAFFGAIIGRNANRIKDGKVVIEGVTYQMDCNDNENNLHSGYNGTDKKVWTVLPQDNESCVTMMCKTNDLEQGLPGGLTMTVTYSLSDDNELRITYDAIPDKKTVINMTSHMYFNLKGHNKGTIEDHILTLYADTYNPVVDAKSIPTGENKSVEGTAFDFRTPKKIGKDINSDDVQLDYVSGYDHNYVVNGNSGKIRHFATVYSEESGICMDLYSDRTGTQFYSGNLIGDQDGKNGAKYNDRSGFCLEPQYIPNAVNFLEESDADCPIFGTDEHYHSESIYKFSVK